MTVNTTTSDTLTETNEESSVREIANPNLSRVLNFAFRQLLQEYVSVTHLDDIKVAFTNGYPDSFRVVSIEELDSLLDEVVEPVHWDAIRNKIFNEYNIIKNYTDANQIFLELANSKGWSADPITPGTPLAEGETFYQKKKGVAGSFTYVNSQGNSKQYKVEGPILNVDFNTLRTD